MNLAQLRSETFTYLMNTSVDLDSLSWTSDELNEYLNEAVFYTQQMTEWFQDFDNLVCTASVSTYTAPPTAYNFIRMTWDRNFLPQTNEYELDRDDPSWRSAAPNINPFRFYFLQQSQNYLISPYPTPANDGVSYPFALSTDAFNRSNGPLASPWVPFLGTPNIVNNTVQPSAVFPGQPSFAYYAGPVWPEDQYSQFTVVALSGGQLHTTLAPVVRYSQNATTATWYQGNVVANGFISIIRQSMDLSSLAITTNVLSTGSLVVNPGDTVKLLANLSVISLIVNGVTALSASDNTLIAGSPGIGLAANSSLSQASLDNWQAGGIVSPFGAVCNFTNADHTIDTTYQFNQEHGIVIGVADTQGAIIMFRPDLYSSAFPVGNYANQELGELQVYNTDEQNIGMAFVRYPDTMSADTDTPQLPPQTHHALVMYALMKCFVREGEFQDIQLAQGWFTAYADWMESVLENKARWWSTRVRSLEPFEEGSLFAKRLQAVGYPLQIDLQPSY